MRNKEFMMLGILLSSISLLGMKNKQQNIKIEYDDPTIKDISIINDNNKGDVTKKITYKPNKKHVTNSKSLFYNIVNQKSYLDFKKVSYRKKNGLKKITFKRRILKTRYLTHKVNHPQMYLDVKNWRWNYRLRTSKKQTLIQNNNKKYNALLNLFNQEN